MQIVFVGSSLINSQDQKAYVEISIKRSFHGCNDTEELGFDGNCVVRFDEIAGISMGFLGVRQGNAGVLL